jgi:hypothetical protein
MVKLAGPCFSMGASGKLGGALVFSTWKGRPLARKLVTPANPQSALQVSMRAMMRFLAQAWEGVGSTPQGSWEDRAAAGNYSPFNAFVSNNQSRWREFQAPGQTDPVAETGDLPVATLDSATGGVHCMDIEYSVDTANDVWGMILFRSPTGTFDTSLSNAIRVIPVSGTGTFVYTDSGLDPGDYYYDARFFTTEGSLGPEEGEVTDTVL